MITEKKFTVIEVIVSIAIAAILAALIIGVIFLVNKKAEKADTINNLKQIGVAMVAYSSDYNGQYPYIDTIATTADKAKTLWLLLPGTDFKTDVFYPMDSTIHREEEANPAKKALLDNPRSLYAKILSDPTSADIPKPGFAYSPTYNDQPLSQMNPENITIPIVASYADQYNTVIYHVHSDGSVHNDLGEKVTFE